LNFALYERPEGVETTGGVSVVYDLANVRAYFGAARVDGPALVWELVGTKPLVTHCHKVEGAALEVDVELDPAVEWIARCDRVEFPAGGVAYRHVHPGPGIRRLLHGALTIDSPDGVSTYRSEGAWFEGADQPVLATASVTDETAFVRVLLLPAAWQGRRSIRYLDPADDEKPKLQQATVLLEEPLTL